MEVADDGAGQVEGKEAIRDAEATGTGLERLDLGGASSGAVRGCDSDGPAEVRCLQQQIVCPSIGFGMSELAGGITFGMVHLNDGVIQGRNTILKELAGNDQQGITDTTRTTKRINRTLQHGDLLRHDDQDQAYRLYRRSVKDLSVQTLPVLLSYGLPAGRNRCPSTGAH